jgi:hypothetical protein
MKGVYLKALCVAILLVIVVSLAPIGRTEGSTQDTTASFLVQDHPEGTTYKLNVTIPSSLYQTYTQKSHFLFSPQDFGQFVTPYTFKPVADRLWQICNNTEDFTNAVLMMVHQINYTEIEPSFYPVETLVMGQGDCDLFVYIAASILEAGGIHTVILYYRDELHMELAVDLGYQPVDTRGEVYSVTYQDRTYYVAEATGGSWRYGWRVGECSSKYQNATSQVIVPVNMEQTSISQVSASLQQLDPSTLTLQLSTSTMLQDGQVTITGQIFPEQANENVTLRARSNGGSWFTVGQAPTDSEGKFSYDWVIQTQGSMEVQATWQGNDQLNGSVSSVSGVYVVSVFLILLVLLGAVLVVVLIFGFVLFRRRRHGAVTAGVIGGQLLDGSVGS